MKMHSQGVGGSWAGRAANASRSADYFMKWSRLAPLQRESCLAICLRHPLHNTTKCQSKDTAPRSTNTFVLSNNLQNQTSGKLQSGFTIKQYRVDNTRRVHLYGRVMLLLTSTDIYKRANPRVPEGLATFYANYSGYPKLHYVYCTLFLFPTRYGSALSLYRIRLKTDISHGAIAFIYFIYLILIF